MRREDLWTGRSCHPDSPVDAMADSANQNQDVVCSVRTLSTQSDFAVAAEPAARPVLHCEFLLSTEARPRRCASASWAKAQRRPGVAVSAGARRLVAPQIDGCYDWDSGRLLRYEVLRKLHSPAGDTLGVQRLPAVPSATRDRRRTTRPGPAQAAPRRLPQTCSRRLLTRRWHGPSPR
jgi:hypothetical protein